MNMGEWLREGCNIRGDPFITFAGGGEGGGYPKANVVSEVA